MSLEVVKINLLVLFVCVCVGCGPVNTDSNPGNTNPGSPPSVNQPFDPKNLDPVGFVPKEINANQDSVKVLIPLGASSKGRSAFGVNPLTVPVGTVVVWVNNDIEEHTTTSLDGHWSSQRLSPGDVFYYVFTTPGDYVYFCEIAGEEKMWGTLHVVPSSK